MSTRQFTETELYRQQVMANMPRQPNEAAVASYFSRMHRWPDLSSSRPPQRMGEPRTPTAPPHYLSPSNADPAVVSRVRESLDAQYRRHGFRPPADSRELNSQERYVDRAASAIQTVESYNLFQAQRAAARAARDATKRTSSYRPRDEAASQGSRARDDGFKYHSAPLHAAREEEYSPADYDSRDQYESFMRDPSGSPASYHAEVDYMDTSIIRDHNDAIDPDYFLPSNPNRHLSYLANDSPYNIFIDENGQIHRGPH